jgi:flavin-dependent dehydrogenase
VATESSASQQTYDVAILGGGLAGLTLGLQLKRQRPDTSVFIAEKRQGPAPEAAFKVGESTVEIAANYFAEIVGMKDHLESDQLHKAALRFWFPAGDNSDISQRVEFGVPFFPPVPSYQLDRGRFENELARRNLEAGVDLLDNCFVQDVELGADGGDHTVTVVRGRGAEPFTVSARWVVDAAGRGFILKRKLGLEEGNDHAVNSSWWRLAGGIDIEEWVDDDDSAWFERMTERGIRKFSTNHLCGEGYWVWLIPLSSGPISIGIVADPAFHPFERISTLEGSLEWLREHEPQLAAVLDARQDQVEDFLKIEHFSHGAKQVFSGEDRWCLVGEAGPFLDPFYSPGSDFIAMGNMFTGDLIVRQLEGEDVADRAKAHEKLFLGAYNAFLPVYLNRYGIWGDAQVMAVKIALNNIFYWSTSALLFFNRKLTDLDFMSAVQADIERIWRMTTRLEELYSDWHALDGREWRRGFVPVMTFPGLGGRHVELVAEFDEQGLKDKVKDNADLLEASALVVFHKAASLLDERPDENARIDPQAISLKPERWEQDGLYSDSGLTLAEAREKAEGLENFWMESVTAQDAQVS